MGAEEIAALNLAKYRKAQQELEEAEERSKMAGAQISLARRDLFFKSIMLVKVLPMSRSKTKASNQVVKRSLPTKNSNIKEHQQQIANSCSFNIITHSLNYSTENALLSMLA